MKQAKAPELLKEVQSHFNEPVIIATAVARVVGYCETDEDCYMIYKTDDGEIRYNTMVGGYCYLGSLKYEAVAGEWNDLSRLDCLLKYNGCPAEPNFILEL